MFEKGTYLSGDEVERADAMRMNYGRVLKANPRSAPTASAKCWSSTRTGSHWRYSNNPGLDPGHLSFENWRQGGLKRRPKSPGG
jgi:hypothetical protein